MTFLSANAAAFLAGCLALMVGGEAGAVDVQTVTSEQGVTAWLVEDYSVPIVSIRFAFEGGSVQDPVGKEGLANFMTSLFDEGAGEFDSAAFQERLDDAGAEMRFSASRDEITGSMRMLAETRDEALDLLRLAVVSPRFDAAPTERIRSQILSGILAAAKDPNTEAELKWSAALYGSHPYARQSEGTPASLAAITRGDLQAFHKRIFARSNLHVGVVGAIDAAALKTVLDKVFGSLPADASLVPVAPVTPKLGDALRVTYDLPQTSLQLAYPGVGRGDPDFFAAYLMNHILGGGSFTSRLFDEVREKRGLAYSAGSSLVNRRYASLLVVGTSTRADRADETLAVVRETVRRMAEEGPTEAELAAVKKYVIGAYPINNLDSSLAIASTLVEIQAENLGIDYMERRAGLIDAVTLADVRQVAKRLLSGEPSVLVVGPENAAGSD